MGIIYGRGTGIITAFFRVFSGQGKVVKETIHGVISGDFLCSFEVGEIAKNP